MLTKLLAAVKEFSDFTVYYNMMPTLMKGIHTCSADIYASVHACIHTYAHTHNPPVIGGGG